MGIPRPNRRHEVAAVLTLAEVAVLHALLVHVVAVLNLDARVDDGDEPKVFVLHFLYKFREIREIFFIQCEILKILHIVDIHVDHIQRDVIFPIAVRDLSEILLGLVAPPALSETKGEFRRDVASADDLPELLYDVVGRAAVDHEQVQTAFGAGHLQRIHPGISDVKCHGRGIVEEQPESFFSGYHDKIVGPVKGTLVLRVVGVVRAVADIAVAPLVQPPVGLPKPVYDIRFFHNIGKTKSLFRFNSAVSRRSFPGSDLCYHRLC